MMKRRRPLGSRADRPTVAIRTLPKASDDELRGLTLLRELEPGMAEHVDRLALTLIRFVCGAYVTGHAAYWNAAICAADDALGPVDGPAVFARCSALVLAFRQERRGDFHFLPAPCGRISADESDLVGLLRAARSQDRSDLEHAAQRFAGMDRPVRLVLAVRALVGVIDRIGATAKQPDPAATPPGPTGSSGRLH